MNISQDTFNKLITIYLVLFFSAVYLISWTLGKNIDWQNLLVFIVPTINHIVHQVTNSQATVKTIEGKNAATVATIQATGVNGTPPTVPAIKP